MPLKDLLLVVAYAVPATAVVACLGAVLLHLLRRRSLQLLQTVVATSTVLATIAGVVVVSLAMLLNSHDLTVVLVVLVVLVVSTLAGVLAAWLLGRRVARTTAELAEAAQIVGSGYQAPPDLPAELDAVSRQLASTDEKLIRSRQREVALEASRRNLVAWISHDLRTPLAGIRAMAEALEDDVTDGPETAGRYHTQIRQETDRLATMVDDLFELSRIHSGSLRLSVHQIGLADLVADAVASVAPVADAKGVRVVGDVPREVPVRVDADGMGRVLRNLLVNAIRHAPSDGTIQVSTSVADDGETRLAVHDSCGGIPEQDLPHVFDVAFRGEQARTPTESGGGGLGLAIARGIVEAHAGQIGVANVGPGCQFVVRLPSH